MEVMNNNNLAEAQRNKTTHSGEEPAIWAFITLSTGGKWDHFQIVTA